MRLLVIFSLLCATPSFALISEALPAYTPVAYLRPMAAYVGADTAGNVWTCAPSTVGTVLCVKIPANLFTTCSFSPLGTLGVVAVVCEEFI